MAGLAVVRHWRIHVHLRPDEVPRVLADDPVLTAGPGAGFDRVRDIGQVPASQRSPQALPQSQLTRLDQRGGLARHLAYGDRDRRIAVPAAHDGARVNRDDVTSGQRLVGARYPVHDAIVHGRADRCRIAVVAKEGGLGAAVADLARRDRVELGCGDSGLDSAAHGAQRARYDEACLAHQGELAWRLDLDGGSAAAQHGEPSSTYRTRRTAGRAI